VDDEQLRVRDGDQPLPTPNSNPTIHDLVAADLMGRQRLGIQRYGSPLQAHNGRSALRDLYEELLDASCYVRQALEEGLAAGPMFHMQPDDVLLIGNVAGVQASQAITRAFREINPDRRVICFTGEIDLQLLRGVDPSEAEPVELDVTRVPGAPS
jgi:hypothetical protein